MGDPADKDAITATYSSQSQGASRAESPPVAVGATAGDASACEREGVKRKLGHGLARMLVAGGSWVQESRMLHAGHPGRISPSARPESLPLPVGRPAASRAGTPIALARASRSRAVQEGVAEAGLYATLAADIRS